MEGMEPKKLYDRKGVETNLNRNFVALLEGKRLGSFRIVTVWLDPLGHKPSSQV
jgi:hypothetical protein